MSGAGIYIKTDSGLVAAATVPGPQGSQGPQSSLTTGTVTTGAAGTSAAATITGWAVTYGDTGWRQMKADWNVSPRSSGDGFVERLLIRSTSPTPCATPTRPPSDSGDSCSARRASWTTTTPPPDPRAATTPAPTQAHTEPGGGRFVMSPLSPDAQPATPASGSACAAGQSMPETGQ